MTATPPQHPREQHIAPDGSLLVELEAVEWRNGLWVHSPRVIEVATERVLLDLWGSDWDAVPSFPRPGAVHLSLRRWHYGGDAEAEIDLATQRYSVLEDSGEVSGPLAELRKALDEAADRAVTKLGARPVIEPPRATVRGWLLALLILVVALGVIAAATVITLATRQPPPKARLDTIPPMPDFSRRP